MAVDMGMVDFYLRWWAGHHCIFMGYVKEVRGSSPVLEEPARDPFANANDPNRTAVVSLRKHSWCQPASLGCLTIGMLPSDLFPAPGQYAAVRDRALVGRTPRPDIDPRRSHRLRLDRYDERDFSDLRGAMEKDGLWVVGATS